MEIVQSTPSYFKISARDQSPCCIQDNIVFNKNMFLQTLNFSIGQILFQHLNYSPNYVGQIDPSTNKQMTYAQIKERSIRCALWLKNQGVKRGDVVAVFMHHHLDCMTSLLGSLFIGACLYPMHPQVDIHECRYFISFMRPKIVFVNAEIAGIMAQAAQEENIPVELIIFGEKSGFQSIEEIIENQDAAAVAQFHCRKIFNPDDTALYILSNKGTWLTKTMMISHNALINYMMNDDSFAKYGQKIVMWFSTFQRFNDIILLLQSIYYCKTWILYRGLDEELACELVEKYKVEWIWLRSFNALRIIRKNLFSKYRLSSLKKMVIGDVPRKRHLRDELKRALPDIKVVFVYTMTEFCGTGVIHTENNKIDSIGYGICHSRLKVLDVTTGNKLSPNYVGELVWKSPYIMNAYYNNINRKINKVTRKVLDRNGWLHSGDTGYYDADGEVHIRTRHKTIEVNEGFVYLSEIESVLRSHPAVREVAVIRFEENIREQLFAFVSIFPDKQVRKDELKSLVADALEDNRSRYRLFKDIKFLDELPRTETHKIAKKELREIAISLMIKYPNM